MDKEKETLKELIDMSKRTSISIKSEFRGCSNLSTIYNGYDGQIRLTFNAYDNPSAGMDFHLPISNTRTRDRLIGLQEAIKKLSNRDAYKSSKDLSEAIYGMLGLAYNDLIISKGNEEFDEYTILVNKGDEESPWFNVSLFEDAIQISLHKGYRRYNELILKKENSEKKEKILTFIHDSIVYIEAVMIEEDAEILQRKINYMSKWEGPVSFREETLILVSPIGDIEITPREARTILKFNESKCNNSKVIDILNKLND